MLDTISTIFILIIIVIIITYMFLFGFFGLREYIDYDRYELTYWYRGTLIYNYRMHITLYTTDETIRRKRRAARIGALRRIVLRNKMRNIYG